MTVTDILRQPATPRITFATGLGAEGCVIITGVLFPETYDVWEQLEHTYGVTIRAETLAQQAASLGDALWTRDPDLCCARRKLEPLARERANCDAWITSIRRDQTPVRANAQVVELDANHGIAKSNPLVEWSHDDALHERGYASIGCQPCTSAIVPDESPRAGRWRGADRRECGLHRP